MKIKTHPFLAFIYPKNQLCIQLFLLLHHLLSGESDTFGYPISAFLNYEGKSTTKWFEHKFSHVYPHFPSILRRIINIWLLD